MEWEDIGGAIEVRFADHKILDIQRILVIGQQLAGLVEQGTAARTEPRGAGCHGLDC